jgi:hypothetical protein
MNYGFVLTGAVPNMIACRSETTDVALLVGQDPIYGTGAIQATGGTILGFQTEQCRTYYYFYSAADMLMAGSAIGETLAPPSYPTSSGYGLNILRCNFVHNCIFMNNAFNCASNLGIQNACVQFDAIPDGVVMIGNPCTPGVGPGTTYIMPPLVANTEYGDPLTIIPNGTTFPETATVHYKKRTFSQLPKNINFGMKIGDEYYLTDLTSNAYGAVAAGGGTQSGWVKFNGTNWKVFSP